MGWERFLQYIRFDVGDSSCVQFWHDKGGGGQLLRVVISDLYDCLLATHAFIDSLLGDRMIGNRGVGMSDLNVNLMIGR